MHDQSMSSAITARCLMPSDLSIDGIRGLDKYGVKCTVAKTLRVRLGLLRLSHFQCYVQLGTPSRYRSAQ